MQKLTLKKLIEDCSEFSIENNTHVCKITPKIASRIVQGCTKHLKNRDLFEKQVSLYKEKMEDGSWNHLSGDPIMWDDQGDLIGGRTRMTALSRLPSKLDIHYYFSVKLNRDLRTVYSEWDSRPMSRPHRIQIVHTNVHSTQQPLTIPRGDCTEWGKLIKGAIEVVKYFGQKTNLHWESNILKFDGVAKSIILCNDWYEKNGFERKVFEFRNRVEEESNEKIQAHRSKEAKSANKYQIAKKLGVFSGRIVPYGFLVGLYEVGRQEFAEWLFSLLQRPESELTGAQSQFVELFKEFSSGDDAQSDRSRKYQYLYLSGVNAWKNGRPMNLVKAAEKHLKESNLAGLKAVQDSKVKLKRMEIIKAEKAFHFKQIPSDLIVKRKIKNGAV